MDYSAKFQRDLQNGQKGERHVAQFFKKLTRAKSICAVFAGKRHDFVLKYEDGREISWECKSDFGSKKSGNIYLEYKCSGKDSGLKSTSANKYAILIPHENIIFVFEPGKMMEYLESSKHRSVKGGDRNATWGYLVSLEIMKKLSFVEVFETNCRLTNE